MSVTPSCARDVVLLSAGPGDLELLTIKAVKALASAQVLLLDDLANPEIVELAPQARVIRVGKRGGCRSTPQEFICRLMRRYALQGLRVVRVKGGDALLFGRAGEEIAFLRRAGVGVQVINGVSAAFAAAAALEVALTHRSHCHGITFVICAHPRPRRAELGCAGGQRHHAGHLHGPAPRRCAGRCIAGAFAGQHARCHRAGRHTAGAATSPHHPGRPGDDSQRTAAGFADLVAGGRCAVRSCCRVRRPRWSGGGAGNGVRAAHSG